MESFYGGRPGQSFEVRPEAIFNTKVQLDADAAQGWLSPVSVGEFAIVTYGLPNEPAEVDEQLRPFRTRANADILAYGKTYNSTLWVKEFDKEKENTDTKGISYRLLASMTGNTPDLQVSIQLIPSSSNPRVEKDVTNLDQPDFKFFLPKPWKIQHEVVGSDTLPSIAEAPDSDPIAAAAGEVMQLLKLPKPWEIEKRRAVADATPTIAVEDPGTIDAKLIITLPDPWTLKMGDPLDAGMDSTLEKQYDEAGEPYMELRTAKRWNFSNANVSTIKGNVNDDPSVVMTPDTTTGEISLSFTIPRSQLIEVDTEATEHLAPAEHPTVEQVTDTNGNITRLTFSLPDAAIWFQGTKLGLPQDYTAEEGFDDEIRAGDYYFNMNSGVLYRVTEVYELDGQTVWAFQFLVDLQVSKPKIGFKEIDPYDVDGNPVSPFVERALAEDGSGEWLLTFNLPKAPTFTPDFSFVGADEIDKADLSLAVTSPAGHTMTAKVPRGARWFCGTEEPTVTGDELPGDYYLRITSDVDARDLETNALINGDVYKFTTDWGEPIGTLRGPVGAPLTVVRSYAFTENVALDGKVYTLDTFHEYIEADMAKDNIPIDSSMVFDVTYNSVDDGPVVYWYYKNNAGWAPPRRMTGSSGNFLLDDYAVDGVLTEKAYSVPYINDLIGETNKTPATTLSERTAYSKKQTDDKVKELNDTIDDLRDLITELQEENKKQQDTIDELYHALEVKPFANIYVPAESTD